MTMKVENQVYILMSVISTKITMQVISMARASAKREKSTGPPLAPCTVVELRLKRVTQYKKMEIMQPEKVQIA